MYDYRNFPYLWELIICFFVRHHGWAGAHAWLDKEDNLAEYKDVYGRLGVFFNNSAKVISS